jgi:effector-binding domain-containing protein
MEIVDKSFHLDIYGFSGTAANGDYVGTAFKLMDKMWQVVRTNEIKNKGLNVIVYEDNEKVFAGVELDDQNKQNTGLEYKNILLNKYAYHKHIGPYNLIKQEGQKMKEEIKMKGLETCPPYIEIYGHWNSDETKLETELFMSLK